MLNGIIVVRLYDMSHLARSRGASCAATLRASRCVAMDCRHNVCGVRARARSGPALVSILYSTGTSRLPVPVSYAGTVFFGSNI